MTGSREKRFVRYVPERLANAESHAANDRRPARRRLPRTRSHSYLRIGLIPPGTRQCITISPIRSATLDPKTYPRRARARARTLILHTKLSTKVTH